MSRYFHKILLRTLAPVVSALILLGHNSVWAVTVADLQDAQRLQISSELRPADNIVPGQRVELIIEIATDRWFNGGTRLQIPEVPGLVILQTNQFASNSSENRGGNSWVVQRWSLDVYPQRAGKFTIPSVTAVVKVNDGNTTGVVEGELQSPPLNFQATIPPSLANAPHWVAAPRFQVSQNFDRELNNLQIGDAFSREIIFQASDVMAMMLPTFTVEQLEGLRAYPEPSSLSNNSNRGQTTARRVEHISYIAEVEGEYQLPALDFYWWDTHSGELQMRFLPAVDITVGAAAIVDEVKSGSPKHTLPTFNRQTITQIVVYALLFIMVFSTGWFVFKNLPRKQIQRAVIAAKRHWQHLLAMTRPALPETLNPGDNAGE